LIEAPLLMRWYCFYVCALSVQVTVVVPDPYYWGEGALLSLFMFECQISVMFESVVVLLVWLSRGDVLARQ
jgi:hypothetical protein